MGNPMHYRTLRGIDVHYVIRFTSCVEDVALSGVLLALYFTSELSVLGGYQQRY